MKNVRGNGLDADYEKRVALAVLDEIITNLAVEYDSISEKFEPLIAALSDVEGIAEGKLRVAVSAKRETIEKTRNKQKRAVLGIKLFLEGIRADIFKDKAPEEMMLR